MCLGGQKSPDPPPVAPAPTREQIAAEKATETVETTKGSAAKVAERQGVYDNLKTTRRGDPGYGNNVSGSDGDTFARFGRVGQFTAR